MTEAILKRLHTAWLQLHDIEENYEDSKRRSVVARSWEAGCEEQTGRSQRLFRAVTLLRMTLYQWVHAIMPKISLQFLHNILLTWTFWPTNICPNS